MPKPHPVYRKPAELLPAELAERVYSDLYDRVDAEWRNHADVAAALACTSDTRIGTTLRWQRTQLLSLQKSFTRVYACAGEYHQTDLNHFSRYWALTSGSRLVGANASPHYRSAGSLPVLLRYESRAATLVPDVWPVTTKSTRVVAWLASRDHVGLVAGLTGSQRTAALERVERMLTDGRHETEEQDLVRWFNCLR